MSSPLRFVIALSLAALAAVAVTSCSSSESPGTSTTPPASTSAAKTNYPVTIEKCGKTYTYTQPPQRVVVGWPTTVDTLTALGVGQSVAGYISAEFGPTPNGVEAKKLSDDYVPSSETILAAKPDFFLANGDSQVSGERGGITADDLSKIDANTYVMGDNCKDSKDGTTVDTVYQDITNLGRIFDVPDKAAALISTLRTRVAAAAGLRGNSQAPRIAYVNVSAGKLYALSGLSYAAQIEGAGAVNVFADLKESFAEISPEKVLTLNADAIVFSYSINTETADQQKSEIVKRLSNSKAVRDGKLIGVPVYLSEGPGLAVIEAIELITKNLYT